MQVRVENADGCAVRNVTLDVRALHGATGQPLFPAQEGVALDEGGEGVFTLSEFPSGVDSVRLEVSAIYIMPNLPMVNSAAFAKP